MTDITEIENLLADILDETKPLPKVAAAPVPKPAVIMPTPPKPAPPTPFDNVVDDLLEEAALPPAQEILAAEPEPVFADSGTRDLIRIPMPVFDVKDLAGATNIRNFAQLVRLNTARWHAKVKDRQASRDAARVNEADERSFETRKLLLVGADDKLKAIHKVIDTARGKHYEMTAPWTTTGMDDTGRRTGARMLPNTLFFEYTSVMAKALQEMNAALDVFVPEYPALIEAAKKKLGKRFDMREYPPADGIRRHFDLSFDFQPIPVGSDFKGLPQQQLDALARHLNGSTEKMMVNAMQDMWARLYEAVARMAERLASPDKLFHYTLVDNVRECARLVKHLNVINDQRVEAVRIKVEKHLVQHDAKTLRENSVLRTQVGAMAASILDDMNKAGGAK